MAVGYSPEPKEIQFHALDYKNEVAIQGLLRFYYSLKSNLEYKPNFEITSILIDFKLALENSGLTQKQMVVAKLYMEGWTEDDIGKRLGITQQAVNKHIKLICKKMSNYLEG